MRVRDIIETKLRDTFAPEMLEVIDESHQHAGHAGARPGGQTHFRVCMTASALAGMGRLARQRAVNACLAEELAGPVHALAMELDAPA